MASDRGHNRPPAVSHYGLILACKFRGVTDTDAPSSVPATLTRALTAPVIALPVALMGFNVRLRNVTDVVVPIAEKETRITITCFCLFNHPVDKIQTILIVILCIMS